MDDARKNGQYGKQNPMFMYQGTVGYSIKAELNNGAGKETAKAFIAVPPCSGEDRCGTLP